MEVCRGRDGAGAGVGCGQGFGIGGCGGVGVGVLGGGEDAELDEEGG